MSAKVPTIIYSNKFLGRTTDLPSTTLFTPSLLGQFRASIYTTGNAGLITAQMTYNDSTQSVSSSWNAPPGNPVAAMVFEAEPSAPVVFSTNGGTPGPWNLYVTIEAL